MFYSKTKLKVVVALCVLAAMLAAACGIAIAQSNSQTNDSFHYVNLEEGHTYYIASSKAARQLIDVSGGSSQDTANIQLYEANETSAQKWKVEASGEEGYIKLVNPNGKVMDVAGGEKKSETNVWQYSQNGTDAQKWRVRQNDADGTYTLESKLDFNLVLDCAAGQTGSGTNIQVYTSNNTAAQKFNLYDLTPTVKAGDTDITDGNYCIQSTIDSNYYVDLDAGKQADCTNIHLWSGDKKNNNQIFYIEQIKDTSENPTGFYTISNCQVPASRVDVAGGCVLPGTNVWQYTNNDSDAQKWAINKTEDGSYTFTNKATGLVMDISGGRATNGQNIQGYLSNSTKAQKFNLVAPFKFTPTKDNITFVAPTGSLVYDGKAKSASFKVQEGVKGLGQITPRYAASLTADEWTTEAPKNVGTYYVKACIAEGEAYKAADLTDESWKFTITKATPTIGGVSAEATYTIGTAATFSYTYDGDGVVSVSSNAPAILTATVDTSQKEVTVTPVDLGSATITLDASATENYNATSFTQQATVKAAPEWKPLGGITITHSDKTTSTVNYLPVFAENSVPEGITFAEKLNDGTYKTINATKMSDLNDAANKGTLYYKNYGSNTLTTVRSVNDISYDDTFKPGEGDYVHASTDYSKLQSGIKAKIDSNGSAEGAEKVERVAMETSGLPSNDNPPKINNVELNSIWNAYKQTGKQAKAGFGGTYGVFWSCVSMNSNDAYYWWDKKYHPVGRDNDEDNCVLVSRAFS